MLSKTVASKRDDGSDEWSEWSEWSSLCGQQSKSTSLLTAKYRVVVREIVCDTVAITDD